MATLAEAACTVLATPEPAEKVRLTEAFAAAWRRGEIGAIGKAAPPDRPARAARPVLLPPRDMPKRRGGVGPQNRIALLHALAHIELNAIDLSWDIVVRYIDEDLPRAFYDDWVGVAADEAKHHRLLAERLRDLDASYGDLPAHDGLWEAASDTAHDIVARLAVVPMVLEARGLDVTPEMSARLRRAGDEASAAIIDIIHRDEVGHVAAGRRWFDVVCARRGLDPVATYHDRVRRCFRGTLKPPFNARSRDEAGLPAAFYAPLAPGAP
jgi:uncharacterized ferritin-like protein (DUF455 family)